MNNSTSWYLNNTEPLAQTYDNLEDLPPEMRDLVKEIDQNEFHTEKKETFEEWEARKERNTAISITLTVAFLVFMSGRIWYRSYIWKSGRIPRFFGYRKSSIVSILINLGYNLMLLERESIGEKRQFMQSYFKRNYPGASYNIPISMKNAQVHPLKNKSIGEWFRKKLKDEGARSNILYYAVGICWADGRINKRESERIKEFNKALGLPIHYLNEITAMYEARYFREQEEARSKSAKHGKSSTSILKIYFDILGIEETKDFERVKKAYKSLAKIHHPDMLATKTVLEQEIAEQKFIEIKIAYESLEEILT